MKPYNAAPLLLVSWYLFAPSMLQFGRRATEPVRDWRLIEKFELKRECQEWRTKLIGLMPNSGIERARCIPSDAPDLMPEEKPGVVDDLAAVKP
jgi:hypothetical protein